ncbi:LCP family protein [Phototrophicus methaneseepsis]|uniref:LCP family protein n=1 Tax=Phototrophicus methaneseepsis TaxID=2710758 RepID=A0A7S8ICW9_9CHLR|nr:LCP family protein [Phototrophicus methaneseepsis]QPC80759.1 LCP family protein [Phototrophicus methaneseepsis]
MTDFTQYQTGAHDDNTTVNPRVAGSDENVSIPAPSAQPIYSTSYYLGKNTNSDSAEQEPYSPQRARKRRSRNRNALSEWAWVIIAGALFSIVLIMSLSAFLLVRSSQQEMEVIPTADISAALPTPVLALSDYSNEVGLDVGETLLLPDGSSIILEPWDGQSRFTMVMVGLDRRPGETGLTYRTDTMMIVSLNPTTNSIGILSIPRDLYVDVPGYSSLLRINSPMIYGELQSPGYGPILMQQTVQRNFGIRVNEYVAIDFQAFIDVVDAIGGVDVTIDYTINDPQYPDMNYGYDPFYLPTGTHHLNGYDTLRFARTRHGDSDISRAERQQQAIFAIRDKIMRADMVPTLVLQAPAFWQAWEEHVYTGLTLEQIIQLGLYAKDIPAENIHTGVMDYYYLQPYTTAKGEAVLIPNRGRMSDLMVEVFGADYNQ